MKNRLFRRISATASVVFLMICVAGAPAADVRVITVEATPIELYEGKPHRKQVGKLEYLAGFELLSDDATFGGLSGLAVSPDGKSLLAVSDRGHFLTARLEHDALDHLTGIDSWRSSPIATIRGAHAKGAWGDAESLVVEADGAGLVSFEGRHRIHRYRSSRGLTRAERAERVPAPAELANAPFNGGIEAITLLPDGTLMALTEYYENPDGSFKGWLIRNGHTSPISYRAQDGFKPTDLATLPDGDVLLLERDFGITTMAARIRRIQLSDLKIGAQLTGVELARIEHPLAVDNFEGLAVRQDARGNVLVYLVSDDNFLLFQRTLLLQFRLAP